MNALHQIAIVVHVVTSILGLGLCTAVVVTAMLARKNAASHDSFKTLFVRFFTLISVSLALMLLSGILLDVAAHGAWHDTMFFRAGALLVVALGALGGISRGRIRKAASDNGDLAKAFVLVEKLGWAMCGVVALAAVLMVLKPG